MTPGNVEGEKEREKCKGTFPEIGFLPKGVSLSAHADLKLFDSNAILSKRTSGLDSVV